MKKLLAILAISALAISCNNSVDGDDSDSDTLEYHSDTTYHDGDTFIDGHKKDTLYHTTPDN